MSSKTSNKQEASSSKTRNIVTIILLIFLPLIGVILMLFWTKWKKWVKILITTIFVMFFLLPTAFFITYVFFMRPYEISGQAMAPTYTDGQYVLTRIINTKGSGINRGDVVVFEAPNQQNTEFKKVFIKRIIGVPGDVVMIKNGDVFINDKKLDESQYLAPSVKTYPGAFIREGEQTAIPNGQHFVLGDNRPYSSDSREWGFVPAANIISKVSFCYLNCK